MSDRFNNKRSAGFTLIELMITVALIAVIASFAIPQMGRMIDNNRVVSTTNSIVGLLNYSRSESIRRGVRVEVDFSSNPIQASLSSDGTLVRVLEPTEGGISVGVATAGGTSTSAIEFRANGMTEPPTDGSGNPEDVLVTVCSGDATGRRITVSPGGRLTTVDYTCP
ncbi:Tfp pilus assembly protein FimT/FimU [Marinobacter szutsaonensis]